MNELTPIRKTDEKHLITRELTHVPQTEDKSTVVTEIRQIFVTAQKGIDIVAFSLLVPIIARIFNSHEYGISLFLYVLTLAILSLVKCQHLLKELSTSKTQVLSLQEREMSLQLQLEDKAKSNANSSDIDYKECNIIESHPFIKESKRIDMVATTFEGFGHLRQNILDAIKKKAKVRILLLHPGCSSFAERMIQYGKAQTPTAFVSHFYQTLQTLEDIDEESKEYEDSSIEWRFYVKCPTKGAIITDEWAFCWPYFSTIHTIDGSTFRVPRQNAFGTKLALDFDQLWKDEETQNWRKLTKDQVKEIVEKAFTRITDADNIHEVKKVMVNESLMELLKVNSESAKWKFSESKRYKHHVYDSQEWMEADRYIKLNGNVFPAPSQFAKALAEGLPTNPNTVLLDVGCGSGIIGIYSLIFHGVRSVTFNDMHPDAINVTRSNVDWHVETGKLNSMQVSFNLGGFTSLSTELVMHHNLIAFNPPQLPMALAEQSKVAEIEADDVERGYRSGGRDGLDVIRQFLNWFASLGENAPKAVIQLSSFLGKSRIDAAFHEHNFRPQIVADVPAKLRASLQRSAKRMSETDRRDRYLSSDAGVWKKRLWTVQICRI